MDSERGKINGKFRHRLVKGRKPMDRKQRIIKIISGVSGIIGGILMIIAGILDEACPRPLYFVIAMCMLIYAAGIILNYRYVRKQKKSPAAKDSE